MHLVLEIRPERSPVANGGTGGTTKATARAALGITSGSAAPNDAVGDNGDIYFRYPA